MGFAHFGVAHQSLHFHKRSDACSNGAFTNPTLGQTIDSLKPLNISWDTTCLSGVQSVDIILSAPGNDQPLLQGWKNVNFATGYRVVDLLPRKWNDTSSQQLQLTLYQSGAPSFMSPLPAGPVFTATYTAPKGHVPAAADLNLERGTYPKKSSHGKAAAGVIIPLLFIALGVYFYIKFQRRRGQEKRQRWSEAVDKRMSTISTDWKSMSPAGAQAAIRHSMAASNRNSAFSFGAIRPASVVAEPVAPDMAQIRRPGTGLRNATLANTNASAERVSRVSFADPGRVSRVSFANEPRPSTDSRRTVGTVGSARTPRSFHTAYPPVPSLPPAYSPNEKNAEQADGNLSPRQTAGPLTLSPEDIRTRIQSGKIEKDEDGIADVLPALSLMRTGSRSSMNHPFANPTLQQQNDEGADEYILPPSYTTSALASVSDASEADITSANLGPQEVPAMSPDAMLRAYAERRAVSASPGGRLEKRPSFVGTVAAALSKKKKKDRESRQGKPPVSNSILFAGTNTGYPIMEQNAERHVQVQVTATAEADNPYYSHAESVGVGVYGGAQYAITTHDDEYPYGGTA